MTATPEDRPTTDAGTLAARAALDAAKAWRAALEALNQMNVNETYDEQIVEEFSATEEALAAAVDALTDPAPPPPADDGGAA